MHSALYATSVAVEKNRVTGILQKKSLKNELLIGSKASFTNTHKIQMQGRRDHSENNCDHLIFLESRKNLKPGRQRNETETVFYRIRI